MSPAVQGVSLKNRKISPGQRDMIWRKQELVELAPQYQENKKFNRGGGNIFRFKLHPSSKQNTSNLYLAKSLSNSSKISK